MSLFVFSEKVQYVRWTKKAQIWDVTRKSSDCSYFICALMWTNRNDNTTVRTDRKHIIMWSLITIYFALNGKDSGNLYSYSVSQLKEIENSHLLKNSTCKLENIHISTQSQPWSPEVYWMANLKQSSTYDFNEVTRR